MTRKLKISNFPPHIYSNKTYDFATLYTTIPHDKINTRLFYIIDSCCLARRDESYCHDPGVCVGSASHLKQKY
jgi:hypothetical protein